LEKSFRKWNLLGAWLSFGIAACTYFKTQEASGSWWDCGEFMAAAHKLQVVHEPGSPLFLMMAKAISLFAYSPSQIHIFINALSSLASAGTIFFLFLTITHFAGKLSANLLSLQGQTRFYLILASGFIGSIAFAFSDTFWFSAVESEVYALSSFFTAMVFWAILKWEEEFSEGSLRSDRWLFFIALAMGLSIGVHLLNLLTIPALVFVFYFNRYKTNWTGVVIALLISISLLAFVIYGIIPYTLKIASWVDIYTVNHLNYPFNLGAFLYILIVFSLLFIGIWISQKNHWVHVHKVLLGLIFIFIGYSSYFMVILRAEANPPLNNSNPDTVNSLRAYMAREQYEESPLFWGPDYSSKINGVHKGEMEYRKGPKSYEEKGPKLDYTYDKDDYHVFPRLWSKEKANEYANWLGISSKKNPDLKDNLSFFWAYQLDYMYLRYFMWNFAGRQNDTPSGFPNPTRGNWLSGIKFLDGLRLGNQNNLPLSLTQNKAYNRLFLFPLILGLGGLFFQYTRDARSFSVILLLFIFTGMALAFYLNMPPGQPRERDYAFVGSFYAFSIWIGLGFMPFYCLISKAIPDKFSLGLSFVLAFMMVPVWMAIQEWDDHDRSNRTVVKDFASNYLNSCAQNAILFTYGDNETYPLWYAQEVEGIRTDIRVINLNLWDTDWCIDKAKLKVNQSEALPISLSHEDYKDGVRDYLSVKSDSTSVPVELDSLLKFVLSNEPKNLDEYGDHFIPTRHIKLKINPDELIRNGVISEAEKNKIVSSMEWDLDKNTITKGQWLILDIINHNHWKRPIYFCSTSGDENFLGLKPYLQEEGITLRLIPMKKDSTRNLAYSTNNPVFLKNVMEKFHWGNIKGSIHLDDQTNSFADSFKDMFLDLATSLYEHHQNSLSLSVLKREIQVLPENLPPLGSSLNESDLRTLHKSELFIRLGDFREALPLLEHEIQKIEDEFRFFQSQGLGYRRYYRSSILTGKSIIEEIDSLMKYSELKTLSPKIKSLQLNFAGI